MGLKLIFLGLLCLGCNRGGDSNWSDPLENFALGTKKGHVIFYFDPSQDCLSCLDGVQLFSDLVKAYPEIGFHAVLRGNAMNFVQFELTLEENGVHCNAANDPAKSMKARFQLEEKPYLLFLSDQGALVSARKAHYTMPLSKRDIIQWLEHL